MTTWGIGNGEQHQRLRELLGSYALGHLEDGDQAMVRAHVDGCASCQADLAEISPLAGLLAQVDPDHFDLPTLPPGDLGALIRAEVAGEREQREADELVRRRDAVRQRALMRVALGATAAAVVLAVLIGGVALGRSTAPESAAPTATVEPVALSVTGRSIEIATSGLVAHTWGVELRMIGTGFGQGEVFEAWFRDRATGELTTAGSFVGTGGKEMTCNLQSALLRAETSEVVVTDAAGAVVLAAPL